MKSSLYLKWKNITYAPLFLLLIVSTTITGVNANPGPKMLVAPSSEIIQAPGENKTVRINCTDVINYYGADVWLSYNNSIINCTDVTVDGPGQVAPPPGSKRVLSVKYKPGDPGYEAGIIKLSCTFVYAEGADPFNGSGTIAWITFEGLIEAVSNLTFVLPGVRTKMYEIDLSVTPPVSSVMDMDPPVGGEIEVIPEFPTAIIMSLLLITTLAAAFLGKIVWSRKRQS